MTTKESEEADFVYEGTINGKYKVNKDRYGDMAGKVITQEELQVKLLDASKTVGLTLGAIPDYIDHYIELSQRLRAGLPRINGQDGRVKELHTSEPSSTTPVRCTARFHATAVVVNGVRYCTECRACLDAEALKK